MRSSVAPLWSIDRAPSSPTETLDHRAALAAMAGPALAPALPHPVAAHEGHAPAASADGREVIAMLAYPGMTALDVAGPHHFLGATSGARVHGRGGDPGLAALGPAADAADGRAPAEGQAPRPPSRAR